MNSFGSIYTTLIKTFSVSRKVYSIKTIRKDLMGSFIFRYFYFTFYSSFILFAGKLALEIKRTFHQITLAHSSLILNFIAEGHLWAGNKSAQNLIIGEFLSTSIVLLVISYPLNHSLVLLVWGRVLFRSNKEKECLARFPIKDLRTRVWQNSLGGKIYTVIRTL